MAMFASAMFSGLEIAFVSANKLKIELDNNKGSFTAKVLSSFLKKPAKFIGAMLLGNNIALVIYSILMAKFLEPIIINYVMDNEMVILLVQTIISTLLILFFAEFLPKAIFIFHIHVSYIISVCLLCLIQHNLK